MGVQIATTNVALSLIVLRCKNLSSSLHFYERLGLHFVQEQHGNGPLHYTASLNGTVIELYPSKQSDLSCEPVRMGFTVPSLTDTLQAMQVIGIQMASTSQSNRAIVLDPDGRKVEITELSDNP